MSGIDSKSSKETPKAEPAKASADKAVNKALSNAGKGTAAPGGANFHTDAAAGEAAGALGAKAFTAGSDVYFGQGQYQPDTKSGADLINHEMTHVSQGQGVAAPTPGNFKVSSPGDSAEVAARSGTQGVKGSASTIYRDGDGTPATTGTGPAVEDDEGGGGGGAGETGAGGDTEAETEDPYDQWKTAAQAFQRADAVSKWAKVPGSDKNRFTAEDDAFKRRVIYTMQEDSMKVFKEANVDVATWSHFIFAQDSFDKFLPKMRAHGQVNTFLDAEPKTTHLGPSLIAKLKTWNTQSSGKAEATRIFHKAYPTLHDSFPGAGKAGATAVAWQPARIKKLFNVLSMMPTGHVSTVTGGFVLMSGIGYGFWRPGERRVFLPTSSEYTTHRMSGGSGTGLDKTGAGTGASISPDFTSPDGTKKTGNMGHFSATIIHEIGHGVGARLAGGRGNAYAENASSWPGWNVGMSFDSWANELWTNGATGSGAEPTVHRNAKLDDSHAKEFVKSELSSGKNSYSPGWTSNPPRGDMATYVKWRYMSVPLVKWWDYFVERSQDAGNSYRWDEPDARIKGNWVYARLTRGGAGWTKYKKQAWDQKVSWYSLSSPREWFAEQYTQYYRTEKSGAGIDGTTLGLLKDLDKLEFAETGGGEGVTITNASTGDSEGGGSDNGIGDAGGESAAASTESDSTDGGDERPLFFDW